MTKQWNLRAASMYVALQREQKTLHSFCEAAHPLSVSQLVTHVGELFWSCDALSMVKVSMPNLAVLILEVATRHSALLYDFVRVDVLWHCVEAHQRYERRPTMLVLCRCGPDHHRFVTEIEVEPLV